MITHVEAIAYIMTKAEIFASSPHRHEQKMKMASDQRLPSEQAADAARDMIGTDYICFDHAE